MKQRLVGAVILGCLAIIFIPILLDGDGLNSPELDLDMPAAPSIPAIPQIGPLTMRSSSIEQSDIETAQVELDQELIDDNAPPASLIDQSSPHEEDRSEAQEQVETATLSLDGIPQAWSVQLAAFSDQANAETLEADLLGKDYKAYSRPIVSSQGSLVAVYVGPVLTRAEAFSLAEMLKEEFELEGVVVEFLINN